MLETLATILRKHGAMAFLAIVASAALWYLGKATLVDMKKSIDDIAASVDHLAGMVDAVCKPKE